MMFLSVIDIFEVILTEKKLIMAWSLAEGITHHTKLSARLSDHLLLASNTLYNSICI